MENYLLACEKFVDFHFATLTLSVDFIRVHSHFTTIQSCRIYALFLCGQSSSTIRHNRLFIVPSRSTMGYYPNRIFKNSRRKTLLQAPAMVEAFISGSTPVTFINIKQHCRSTCTSDSQNANNSSLQLNYFPT